MLMQPLNGLGESDAVSQTEYDVTAYRNVMDQIQTAQGEVDKAYDLLRAALASRINSSAKKSGYIMRRFGGKSQTRWSEWVGKELGFGKLRFGNNFADIQTHRNQSTMRKVRKKVKAWSGGFDPLEVPQWSPHAGGQKGAGGPKPKPRWKPFNSPRIADRLRDVHNLVRNLNWELNRLRIEMPFDLRQLANQLENYGYDVDDSIVVLKVYLEIKELKNKIFPEMKKRIKEKIAEANLQEKVAADEIRKENTETLTTAERVEKENKEAMERIESKGVAARKSGDQFMLSFDDGGSWTKITRDQLLDISRLPKKLIRQKANEQPQQEQPQSQPQPDQTQPTGGGGGMTDAGIDLRKWAHEYPKKQRETQKANDEAVKEAAEKEGDKAGGNNGAVATAAGLALLLALGQG